MSYANLEKINQDYETKKAEIEAKTVDETYTQAMKDAELETIKQERDDAIAAEETKYSNMQSYLSKGATTINHKTIESETKEVETYLDSVTEYDSKRLSDDSKEHLRALPSINQRTTYQYLTIFSKYQALLDKSNEATETYNSTYDSTKKEYEDSYNETEDAFDAEIEAISKKTITDKYTEDDRIAEATSKEIEKENKLKEINTNKDKALRQLNTDYETLKAEIAAAIAQLSEDKETGFSGNVQVDQNLVVKGDINLEGFIIKGKTEIDVTKLLTSSAIEKMMTTDDIITATAENYTDNTVPSAKLTFAQIKAVNDKIPPIVKTDTEDKYLLPSIYSKSKVNELVDAKISISNIQTAATETYTDENVPSSKFMSEYLTTIKNKIPTIVKSDSETEENNPRVYSKVAIDEKIVSSDTDISTIDNEKTVVTSLDYINNLVLNQSQSYHYASWTDLFKVNEDEVIEYNKIPNCSIIFVDNGGYESTGTYILKLGAEYCLCFQIPRDDSNFIYTRFVNNISSWKLESDLWCKIPVASALTGKIDSTFYNTSYVPIDALTKLSTETSTYNVPTTNYMLDRLKYKVDKTSITNYYVAFTRSQRWGRTDYYSYRIIGYIKPVNRTYTQLSGTLHVTVTTTSVNCEQFDVNLIYQAGSGASKNFDLVGNSFITNAKGKSGILINPIDEDKSAYLIAIVITGYTGYDSCGFLIEASLPPMLVLYSDSSCTTIQSTDIYNTSQSADGFGTINKDALTYSNIYWNEETRALKTELPTYVTITGETVDNTLEIYSKNKVDELIENIDSSSILNNIPFLNPFKDKWIGVYTDDYYDCPPYTIGHNNNDTPTSGLDVSQFWWYRVIRELGGKKGPIYVNPGFNPMQQYFSMNNDPLLMKKGEQYYDIDDDRTVRTYEEDDRYPDVVIFAVGNKYWYTVERNLKFWQNNFSYKIWGCGSLSVWVPLSARYSSNKGRFINPENEYNSCIYNKGGDALKIPLTEISFNTGDLTDVVITTGIDKINLWNEKGNCKIAHMIYTKMLTSGFDLHSVDEVKSEPVNYETAMLAQMIEDCVADTDVVVNTTDTVDNPDKQVASITYISGLTNGMLTTSNVQNEDAIATLAETEATDTTGEETKIMVPSVSYMESKLSAIGNSYDDLDERLSTIETFINKIQIVDD